MDINMDKPLDAIKIEAEIGKLMAETGKLNAEAEKYRREARYAPFIATAVFIGGVVAVANSSSPPETSPPCAGFVPGVDLT